MQENKCEQNSQVIDAKKLHSFLQRHRDALGVEVADLRRRFEAAITAGDDKSAAEIFGELVIVGLVTAESARWSADIVLAMAAQQTPQRVITN